MKVEIVRIVDRGVAHKERLWLRVLADTDLTYFMVIDTTYTSASSISNLQRHTYWFNPKSVRSGDHIILFTGPGKPSESRNNDGSTNYFLYWGLDKTIWNKQGDCAVLFELSNWQTSRYE